LRLEVGRETGGFDYRSYTEFLLDKYGLLDVVNNVETTEPIRVAVTFDGGRSVDFMDMLLVVSTLWIVGVKIPRLWSLCLVTAGMIKFNHMSTVSRLKWCWQKTRSSYIEMSLATFSDF